MHSRSTLLSIFSSLNTSPSSDVCIFSTTFFRVKILTYMMLISEIKIRSGLFITVLTLQSAQWIDMEKITHWAHAALPIEPLGGLEGKYQKVTKKKFQVFPTLEVRKKSELNYLTPDALSIEYLAANGQVSSATFSHEGKVFCDAITRAVCLIWSIGRSKT